ncbi:hypothetical protein PCE1_001792 [Barthelona sp. PCE]
MQKVYTVEDYREAVQFIQSYLSVELSNDVQTQMMQVLSTFPNPDRTKNKMLQYLKSKNLRRAEQYTQKVMSDVIHKLVRDRVISTFSHYGFAVSRDGIQYLIDELYKSGTFSDLHEIVKKILKSAITDSIITLDVLKGVLELVDDTVFDTVPLKEWRPVCYSKETSTYEQCSPFNTRQEHLLVVYERFRSQLAEKSFRLAYVGDVVSTRVSAFYLGQLVWNEENKLMLEDPSGRMKVRLSEQIKHVLRKTLFPEGCFVVVEGRCGKEERLNVKRMMYPEFFFDKLLHISCASVASTGIFQTSTAKTTQQYSPYDFFIQKERTELELNRLAIIRSQVDNQPVFVFSECMLAKQAHFDFFLQAVTELIKLRGCPLGIIMIGPFTDVDDENMSSNDRIFSFISALKEAWAALSDLFTKDNVHLIIQTSEKEYNLELFPIPPLSKHYFEEVGFDEQFMKHLILLPNPARLTICEMNVMLANVDVFRRCVESSISSFTFNEDLDNAEMLLDFVLKQRCLYPFSQGIASKFYHIFDLYPLPNFIFLADKTIRSFVLSKDFETEQDELIQLRFVNFPSFRDIQTAVLFPLKPDSSDFCEFYSFS